MSNYYLERLSNGDFLRRHRPPVKNAATGRLQWQARFDVCYDYYTGEAAEVMRLVLKYWNK